MLPHGHDYDDCAVGDGEGLLSEFVSRVSRQHERVTLTVHGRPSAVLLSAHRGTYRILYRVDDHRHTVPVLEVRHRRDVYRPH